jgi:hypothetical protein
MCLLLMASLPSIFDIRCSARLPLNSLRSRWAPGIDEVMKCQEQGECSCVEVPRTQHHLGIASSLSSSVDGFEHCFYSTRRSSRHANAGMKFSSGASLVKRSAHSLLSDSLNTRCTIVVRTNCRWADRWLSSTRARCSTLPFASIVVSLSLAANRSRLVRATFMS